MHEQIEEKALGILLISTPSELTEYLGILKKEYFLNTFNKEVYVAIEQLFAKGYKPDLISLSNYFRDKGRFDKNVVVRLSKLTMNLPYSTDYYNLFNNLNSLYNKSLVHNFLVKESKKYSEDTLTLDGFIEDMKQLEKSIQFDTTKEQSNSEVIDEIIIDHAKAKNGEMPGIGIGISCLSDTIMLEPVDVLVIGARPAMGKTAMAITIAKNLVLQEDMVVALFCIEQSKKQLLRRLAANLVSVNSAKLRKGGATEDELKRVESIKSNQKLNNLHIFTGDHTTADIASKCSSLKHNGGLDLIIIDYIQKVTSSLPSNASETDKVKQVSNDLKRITQRLEVPQVQYAQLLKSSSRDGARPTLPDLKQTGDIEQDATIVGFLHRPEYYGQKSMPGDQSRSSKGLCEFITAKNREDEVGIKELVFEPWYSRFSSNYGNTISHSTAPEKKSDNSEQTDMPF